MSLNGNASFALQTSPTGRFDRRDARCLLLIAASLAAGLLASWERWGHPLIDSGREMNTPLRLLRGEMLYSDVRYIYGPLSPYLNAALYRMFHPSLWVLWGHGIAATVLILGLAYWLGRQIMGPWPAALACLLVTWVCALKPQGNYILPYAYSALDGGVLALATAAALLLFIRGASARWLALAGVCAALAALAKTEMGIAATGTGLAAILLAGFPHVRRVARWLAIFSLLALGIPTGVFVWLASRVGRGTLTEESFLFFGHVPWQLVYFNQVRFGLDHPSHSAWLMLASLARLIAFAALIAAVSVLAARRKNGGGAASVREGHRPAPSVPAPPTSRVLSHPLVLVALSLVVIAVTSFSLGDLGPLLPMPLLLLALIAAGVLRWWREWGKGGAARRETVEFLTIAVFAFGCIGRILLRVSTGGALSSVLLPASVVIFVWLWVEFFPALLVDPVAQRMARRLTAWVLVIALVATAMNISIRYRKLFDSAIITPRGTMYTRPDLARGFTEALDFIAQHSAPGDAVVVLPEGAALDFFSDRRNPLRDDIVLPGMLDERGEARAIAALDNSRAPLVMITNRATSEFGQAAFGEDYDRTLAAWIAGNYNVCAILGPRHDPNLSIGAPTFFIRAYCRASAATPNR